jgi:hypothetical protein
LQAKIYFGSLEYTWQRIGGNAMIDPSRSKSTLTLIVLLVFAIVAGSWLLFQRQEAVPEVEVVKEDTTELEIVEEPTEQELEPEQEAPAESRKGTARLFMWTSLVCTGSIAAALVAFGL